MKIEFFPFVQTLIEQSEVIVINDNKLTFTRTYGPEIIEEVYLLDNEDVTKLNNVFIEEKNLIDFSDLIIVDGVKFNYENSSLTYKEFSNYITEKLDFKYNPRAFKNEKILFYMGDYDKFFVYGLYNEADEFIKKNKLNFKDNKVVINNEEIQIYTNKNKVYGFNTTNDLYKVVITKLYNNEVNNN